MSRQEICQEKKQIGLQVLQWKVFHYLLLFQQRDLRDCLAVGSFISLKFMVWTALLNFLQRKKPNQDLETGEHLAAWAEFEIHQVTRIIIIFMKSKH